MSWLERITPKTHTARPCPPAQHVFTLVSVAACLVSTACCILLLIAGQHVSGSRGAETVFLSSLSLVSFRGVVVHDAPSAQISALSTPYMAPHSQHVMSPIVQADGSLQDALDGRETAYLAVHIDVFLTAVAWTYPNAPPSVPSRGVISMIPSLFLQPRRVLQEIAEAVNLPPQEWACSMPERGYTEDTESNARSDPEPTDLRSDACTNPFFEAWARPPLGSMALPLGLGTGCLALSLVLGTICLLVEAVILLRPTLLQSSTTTSTTTTTTTSASGTLCRATLRPDKPKMVLYVVHSPASALSPTSQPVRHASGHGCTARHAYMHGEWAPLRLVLVSLVCIAAGLGHYITSLVTAQLVSMLRLVDVALAPHMRLHVHGWGYVALLSMSMALLLCVVVGWAWLALRGGGDQHVHDAVDIDVESANAEEIIPGSGIGRYYDSDDGGFRRSGVALDNRLYSSVRLAPHNDETAGALLGYMYGPGLGICTTTRAFSKAFGKPAISRPLSPESFMVPEPEWEPELEPDDGIDYGDDYEEDNEDGDEDEDEGDVTILA